MRVSGPVRFARSTGVPLTADGVGTRAELALPHVVEPKGVFGVQQDGH